MDDRHDEPGASGGGDRGIRHARRLAADLAETLAELEASTPAKEPEIEIARRVRMVVEGRRRRSQLFPDLLADPAWDILLDLFLARLEDRRCSIAATCIAAAAPPSTALRWLNRLEVAGLVVREPDAREPRRSLVRITDEGAKRMQAAMSVIPGAEACLF